MIEIMRRINLLIFAIGLEHGHANEISSSIQFFPQNLLKLLTCLLKNILST